ncbi:MAG: diacylglycerol kinase [Pseudomonadota bacterium]
MPKSPHRGIARILFAFIYSWQGLRSTFRHEEAFRQELLLCIVLIPLAFVATPEGLERALLLGSLLLLLIVELLNSGIEAAIDRMGNDFHRLSRRAKDMGSAAVMVAIANAALIWVLVLLG